MGAIVMVHEELMPITVLTGPRSAPPATSAALEQPHDVAVGVDIDLLAARS